MKRVLILTAGFGDGHNSAARCVAEALERVSDDVQVEVVDPLQESYGTLNNLARKTYEGMVRFAPSLWGGIFSLVNKSSAGERNLFGLGRLKVQLGSLLVETQPDCVVCTFPLYPHIISEIYKDHRERPFSLITIVTDSISVNAMWYRAPSDIWCVPNPDTARVMEDAGVPADKIKALGFPVPVQMASPTIVPVTAPGRGEARRILYLINTGKKKSGKNIRRLLKLEDVHLTVSTGRCADLKARLIEQTQKYADRVRVFGWTNQVPELMYTSHLIITKAGGATIQEAIAAKTPIIVNQVIPGQEAGNAELITRFRIGAVAEKGREVAELVEEAFAHRGRLWQEWKDNITRISRPDASLRIAEMILGECERVNTTHRPNRLFEAGAGRAMLAAAPAPAPNPHMLLCDFHIHSNYSDGRLTVPELIDFYGRRQFDCICITDHIADTRRWIGKIEKLSSLTLNPSQVQEYFEVLERERRRAWKKYKMLVMTGFEFNKDGYTRKTSAHLLGIDLKGPINPSLDMEETIHQIHAQGGLAVASHPHIMKTEWGKNTLYLWENQERYAPLIDAWEIANRNDIFNPVGLKRLPFIANSDLHKPKHIYSWKTLLMCEKDPEAIKACVRQNEHVAITLYRDLNQMAEFVGREEQGSTLKEAKVPQWMSLPPMPEVHPALLLDAESDKHKLSACV